MPVSAVDSTAVSCSGPDRVGRSNLDPAILFLRHCTNLARNLSKVLILAEDQGDVDQRLSRQANRIEGDPNIDAFLLAEAETELGSVRTCEGPLAIAKRVLRRIEQVLTIDERCGALDHGFGRHKRQNPLEPRKGDPAGGR